MSRIFKRGKNWYVDFEYKGKRHRQSLGTRSKQLAELALKDIDVQVARERLELGAPIKINFREFAAKFLEWYQVQNSKRSFMDYYSLFNSTIIPYFKDIKLADITVLMIEKYKQERSKVISSSTVNKELVALRHLFNKAILWNYMVKNPAKEVDKLKVKQKSVRFLSIDEINAFLRVSPPYARPVFMTAIHAGLRKSELFRLEWEDVDFERKCLIVRNKAEAHTKNYQNREVPMTQQLMDELKFWQENIGNHHSKVFLTRNGEPYVNDIRKTMNNAIRKAEIKSFTLHDLRHTFASHLVMDGVDLPTVQKLMGHSNITTTMIYAHLAPDHLKNAINRLNYRFER